MFIRNIVTRVLRVKLKTLQVRIRYNNKMYQRPVTTDPCKKNTWLEKNRYRDLFTIIVMHNI